MVQTLTHNETFSEYSDWPTPLYPYSDGVAAMESGLKKVTTPPYLTLR
jgi:hypothetical protein